MDKKKVKIYAYAKPDLYFPGIPRRDVDEEEWDGLDVAKEVKIAAVKSGVYTINQEAEDGSKQK